MNTKTLLVLLLCGVCFACNAPQQDGKKTDLTNKNMSNGELREKLALALEDMKAVLGMKQYMISHILFANIRIIAVLLLYLPQVL